MVNAKGAYLGQQIISGWENIKVITTCKSTTYSYIHSLLLLLPSCSSRPTFGQSVMSWFCPSEVNFLPHTHTHTPGGCCFNMSQATAFHRSGQADLHLLRDRGDQWVEHETKTSDGSAEHSYRAWSEAQHCPADTQQQQAHWNYIKVRFTFKWLHKTRQRSHRTGSEWTSDTKAHDLYVTNLSLELLYKASLHSWL